MPGSTANPIISGMVLAGNTPAAPAACPTAEPCWQLNAPGYIVDPVGFFGAGIPTLVPVTEITVHSSFGGMLTTNAIVKLGCIPTTRVICL